jgi:hypothetical protein
MLHPPLTPRHNQYRYTDRVRRESTPLCALLQLVTCGGLSRAERC